MAVQETAETKQRDGRQGRAYNDYTSNPIIFLLHNAAP